MFLSSLCSWGASGAFRIQTYLTLSLHCIKVLLGTTILQHVLFSPNGAEGKWTMSQVDNSLFMQWSLPRISQWRFKHHLGHWTMWPLKPYLNEDFYCSVAFYKGLDTYNIWHMYSFPIAAIISCCRLSDLKQYSVFLLQFWKSQPTFTESKIKVLAGVATSKGSEGRICFLAIFHFWWLPGYLGLWPHLPSSKCITSVSTSIIYHLFLFCSQISLFLPLIKTLWLIGPTLIIQDNLPILRSLIISANSLLSHKITYSQVLGMRTWTF